MKPQGIRAVAAFENVETLFFETLCRFFQN
jgi:hypothetical protein